MNDLRWTAVGTVGEWPENGGRTVTVGPRRIGVYRHAGQWYALKDACPHAGIGLARGPVAEGTVMCLGHGWRFRLADGTIERGPGGFSVPTYPVRVNGETVELGL